jgi:hypothetical protein
MIKLAWTTLLSVSALEINDAKMSVKDLVSPEMKTH